MASIMEKGSMFSPVLVNDLLNKVRAHSSLALLSNQTPIPFVGSKEFTFTLDKELDIVAESGEKGVGGITVAPVTIVPIKFEYGSRISDEFLYATEEEQLNILAAFNDGFSAKVARALDLAAMHGINPRTGSASAVVGNNCFDKAVATYTTYDATKPDENLEDAIAAVTSGDGYVTGMALAPAFGAAMGKLKANGVAQFPEFRFGGNPGTLSGINVDVNRTVSDLGSTDLAIVGDFAAGFKWGYAKEIPMEVIKYGDPDNSGKDLKGYNQVYLRAEVYLGWGILAPSWFARIATA